MEKRNNFEAWIERIDERLLDWFLFIDSDYKRLFNYSVDSLDDIEKYLINKYELKDLSDINNKHEIDAIASYIIKVFAINWPKYKFVIELDDEKNLLFNRPAITTDPEIGMAFSPFQILPSTVNLKRVGGFKKILKSKKRQYMEKYGENII